MGQQRYKIWWLRHRRVSKGERLSDEDNQAGRTEFEIEEWSDLPALKAALRPLQERLRELTARNQQLAEQEMALRQRTIALLSPLKK